MSVWPSISFQPVKAMELSDIESLTAYEDVAKIVYLSATDAEGDTLTYTVSSADTHVTATVSNYTLTLLPAADWNGLSVITGITTSDVENTTTAFSFAVNPVNDAPYFTSQDTLIVEEGESIIIDFIQVADILLKNKGIFIMIDYGNIRTNGHSTIQSVKSHKKTDFLADPGNQDLSHMLDFSLFTKKFSSMNLKVYGPYTQKNFFTSLGIYQLKDKISQNSSKTQKIKIENGLKRILEDSQMGKLFKVIIVSSKKLKYYEK